MFYPMCNGSCYAIYEFRSSQSAFYTKRHALIPSFLSHFIGYNLTKHTIRLDKICLKMTNFRPWLSAASMLSIIFRFRCFQSNLCASNRSHLCCDSYFIFASVHPCFLCKYSPSMLLTDGTSLYWHDSQVYICQDNYFRTRMLLLWPGSGLPSEAGPFLAEVTRSSRRCSGAVLSDKEI